MKVSDITSIVGVDMDPTTICELCNKMQLGPAEYLGDEKGTVQVTVPPTRSDILHSVDIVEDVAIAYGEWLAVRVQCPLQANNPSAFSL